MSFTFKWDYNDITPYIINDTVVYNWLFYVCILAITGTPPTWLQTDNVNWSFIEVPEIKIEDIPEKLTDAVVWDKLLIWIDSEDGNKTKIIDVSLFKWEIGETWPPWPDWPIWPDWPVWPALAFTHEQWVPSATWTINHNLNTFPAWIVVIDSSLANIVHFHTTYVNANTVTLEFDWWFSWTAYLS